jgi:hypothetical protein
MTRVEVLRQQAKIMRSLAESFGSPSIRDDLIGLAKRCEALASEIESKHRDTLQRP